MTGDESRFGPPPADDARGAALPSPLAGEAGPAAVEDFLPPSLHAPRYFLAFVLLAATFLTTTTLGALFSIAVRTDQSTSAIPLGLLLTRAGIGEVWSNPEILRQGLAFSLPLLLILLAHELGHYVPCRRYGLPSTLPLFLPAPFGIGTLGAFIRIRAAIRDKRQLLDVGAGGPIAGFVVLLPFLFLGVARSQPAAVATADRWLGVTLYRPGSSLLMEVAARIFHGPLPADTVLDLHPFALAAWAGLLATSANLLPIGQLDGGHILYAMAGRRQRPAAIVLWLLVAAAGFLWPGWWLLSLLVLIFGLRHPPVADESVRLDGRRRALAWLCLAILALSFMPAPLDVLFLVP